MFTLHLLYYYYYGNQSGYLEKKKEKKGDIPLSSLTGVLTNGGELVFLISPIPLSGGGVLVVARPKGLIR